MTKHRFLIKADLTSKELTFDDPEMVGQWRKVLRLMPGQSIKLFDGLGNEAQGEIISWVGSGGVKLRLNNQQKKFDNPAVDLTLYISILKKDNFSLVVQKAVELGVTNLVPIISARTIKTGLSYPRLEKIIKEATEQSGRSSLMILQSTLSLSEALTEATISSDEVFFCYQEGEKFSSNLKGKKVAVFVGPEGGWTQEELDQALEKGSRLLSLGENILRAETAAIVSGYCLLS